MFGRVGESGLPVFGRAAELELLRVVGITFLSRLLLMPRDPLPLDSLVVSGGRRIVPKHHLRTVHAVDDWIPKIPGRW